MRAEILDDINLRILNALQADGRASNIAVARQVNITAPPTLRRTQMLENQGFIRRYFADLDEKKLGFEVIGFFRVRLTEQSQSAIQAFESFVRPMPNVRECYVISGQFDFMLKGVFRDLVDARRFAVTTLGCARNISSVATSFSTKTIKKEPGVPLVVGEIASPSSITRRRSFCFNMIPAIDEN